MTSSDKSHNVYTADIRHHGDETDVEDIITNDDPINDVTNDDLINDVINDDLEDVDPQAHVNVHNRFVLKSADLI